MLWTELSVLFTGRGVQTKMSWRSLLPGTRCEKKKMESARRGGSEKSSFAICLVKKKSTNLNAQKKSRRLAPDFVMTD